ncbi:MAG: hypothetical protein ACPG77_03725 [Nannocystaceae bacterium]
MSEATAQVPVRPSGDVPAPPAAASLPHVRVKREAGPLAVQPPAKRQRREKKWMRSHIETVDGLQVFISRTFSEEDYKKHISGDYSEHKYPYIGAFDAQSAAAKMAKTFVRLSDSELRSKFEELKGFIVRQGFDESWLQEKAEEARGQPIRSYPWNATTIGIKGGGKGQKFLIDWWQPTEKIPVWGRDVLDFYRLLYFRSKTTNGNSIFENLLLSLSVMVQSWEDFASIAMPLHNIIVALTPNYLTRRCKFKKLRAIFNYSVGLPTTPKSLKLASLFCDPDAAKAMKSTRFSRVKDTNENRIHVEYEVLEALSFYFMDKALNSKSKTESIAAGVLYLLMTSGARTAEIICSSISAWGRFDSAEDTVLQHGVAKRHGGEDVEVIKPLILGCATEAWFNILDETRAAIHTDIKKGLPKPGKSLAEMIVTRHRSNLYSAWNRAWKDVANSEPLFKIHDLRGVYAKVSYELRGTREVSFPSWCNSRLGHVSLSECLPYLSIDVAYSDKKHHDFIVKNHH